jgi:hypothetical protein
VQQLSQSLTGQALVDYVDRHLVPGSVVHLFCSTTTPPKEKFLLLASIGPDEVLAFVINSNLTKFQEHTRVINIQQVSVTTDELDCLTHGSWVNCAEVFREFSLTDIRNALLSDPSRLKTAAPKDLCVRIVESVCDSETLENRHKTRIMSDLI